jgi:hypothetical protein
MIESYARRYAPKPQADPNEKYTRFFAAIGGIGFFAGFIWLPALF